MPMPYYTRIKAARPKQLHPYIFFTTLLVFISAAFSALDLNQHTPIANAANVDGLRNSPADTIARRTSATQTLQYTIDRSQVPSLTYNELTLKVVVGQIDNALVNVNGSAIPHIYDPADGEIRFTTNATNVEIVLTNPTSTGAIGSIAKAPLKDDKDFAWSLGMDDNTGLKDTVTALEQYGWQGTFFLIGYIVDDTRDEDWIVDAPYLHQKLVSGWAIGNHGWESLCSTPISEQDITDGYNRLRGVVNASPRPNYKIISFAAPCFVSDYHPVILNHRDNGTNAVQFNESGNRATQLVDPGASEDIYADNPHNPRAYAFDFDEPVGRDTFLERQISEPETLMAQFDWMASRHAQNGEHLWHNTLVHGGHEEDVGTVASYLHSTYGPNGTDQVWVAPSDQIYSYLLVRERTAVSLVSANPSLPTSTPKPGDTPIPTDTPTPVPSTTPTTTPTTAPTTAPTAMPEPTDTPGPTEIATQTPTQTPTRVAPTVEPTRESTATSTSVVAMPSTTPTATATLVMPTAFTSTPTSTVPPTRTPAPTSVISTPTGNPAGEQATDNIRDVHLPIIYNN